MGFYLVSGKSLKTTFKKSLKRTFRIRSLYSVTIHIETMNNVEFRN